MKYLQSISACLPFLLACATSAQSTGNSSWQGVWQSQLEGQPGVTLTLAEDGGQLAGTIVFYVVSRDGGTAHVIGSSVHWVHPHIDGNTLSFQVKRKSDAKQLDMAVMLMDGEKARLQCVNCGNDSSTAVMVKSRP